jgi:hypothetical protein
MSNLNKDSTSVNIVNVKKVVLPISKYLCLIRMIIVQDIFQILSKH